MDFGPEHEVGVVCGIRVPYYWGGLQVHTMGLGDPIPGSSYWVDWRVLTPWDLGTPIQGLSLMWVAEC